MERGSSRFSCCVLLTCLFVIQILVSGVYVEKNLRRIQIGGLWFGFCHSFGSSEEVPHLHRKATIVSEIENKGMTINNKSKTCWAKNNEKRPKNRLLNFIFTHNLLLQKDFSQNRIKICMTQHDLSKIPQPRVFFAN